jgi:ribose 5-phosphate isomerase A
VAEAHERSGATSLNVIDQQKQRAAVFSAGLIEDGMVVGLGTGTTVAFLLPALADRHLTNQCVATSPATALAAEALGLDIVSFDQVPHLDVAIDGADEVDPTNWLVKGGGGAQTRERIVAAAADRFVVIVSEDKLVDHLSAPIPLELLGFGLASTLAALAILGEVVLRPVPPSPDGGYIADLHCSVDDPERLSTTLAMTPGLISHGLFSPQMVSDLVIGRGDGVEHRTLPLTP